MPAMPVMLVLVGLLLAGAARAATCADCVLPAGTYHTAAPPGWNGRNALPVLVFLHGYGADGRDVRSEDSVGPPAAAAGFLLVTPDGLRHGWAATGTPQDGAGHRDDVAFVHAVLDDVRRRWPVDAGMVVLGGFSLGGSMTWEVACHAPRGFTAFLPMSGGFWQPLPAHCVAPVALRHLHGTGDTTVPLGGRTLFGRTRMGDIAKGLALFAATDRCTGQAPVQRSAAGEDCVAWTGCAPRAALQFCRHPGGHEMRADWLAAGLRWAQTQRGRDK